MCRTSRTAFAATVPEYVRSQTACRCRLPAGYWSQGDPGSRGLDTLIDPQADLCPLAEAMVEAFLTAASEDEHGGVLVEFVEHFEARLCSMIKDEDVLPASENVRRALLEAWDG